MTIPDADKLTDSTTVAKGAAINFLGMLARVSRAFFTLFVTRVSGPVTFGLFTLAAAVVEVVSRFTIFGMDKSLLKFLPETRHDDRTLQYGTLSAAFQTAIVLAVVSTAGLILLAPWVAANWLDKPALGRPLQVIALSILPLTLLALLLSATKALKIMSYDALVTGIVLPLLLLLFAMPIIWTDADVLALSWAFLMAAVTACGIALWFFQKHYAIRKSFLTAPHGTLRRMIAFSTPLGLHDFVQYLGIKLEILILAFFVSPVDLGIYALAVELAFVLKKFRQIFDPILIPVISEAHSERQTLRVQTNMARVIRWVLMLGTGYVGIMSLFAEPILGLFGEAFTRGGTILMILCLAHLINAATGLLDMAMMVSGRPRINLLNMCIVLVTQTLLNLWLIPRYGLLGAAVAALAAFTLIGLVRLGQSVMILRLQPFTRAQLKPLAAGLVAAASMLAVQRFTGLGDQPAAWILFAFGFVLVYFGALGLFRFEMEDNRLLENVLPWKRVQRNHQSPG